MKILLVVDGFGSGGAQRQIVNLGVGLTRRGHIVEFAVYHPEMRHLASIVEASGIPVHVLHRSRRWSTEVVTGLRRCVKAGRYEIVLAFLRAPSFYSEMALLGLKGVKLVISERSAFTPEGSTLLERSISEFHRLADWITVNSHHQRDRMVRQHPWMGKKCICIYNGVDASVFFPRRQPTQGESNRLKFLAIGTVVPRKNAPRLIRALAMYRDLYGEPPTVEWLGKKENSPRGRLAFADASALLKELGLEDAWTWLGERTDVPDLLNTHDALIHPSFLEGLPNVICEALACALPVLTSNTGDHPILVADGERGFLFDPHEPAEIVAAMRRFAMLDRGERQRMGSCALEYASTALSMDTYVGAYEKLLRELVGSDGMMREIR